METERGKINDGLFFLRIRELQSGLEVLAIQTVVRHMATLSEAACMVTEPNQQLHAHHTGGRTVLREQGTRPCCSLAQAQPGTARLEAAATAVAACSQRKG